MKNKLQKLSEHCCCSAFTPHDTDYNCLSPDCVSVIANDAFTYVEELETKVRELEFNMEELQGVLSIPADWPELMARKCEKLEAAMRDLRIRAHNDRQYAWLDIIDTALANKD